MIGPILSVYFAIAGANEHLETIDRRALPSKAALLQRLRDAERMGEDLARMAKKSADDIEELLPLLRKRNVNPEYIRRLEKNMRDYREMEKRK